MRNIKSSQGIALMMGAQALFRQLPELERTEPDEADAIVETIVAHLRSWRPTSISPLGELPAPEGPNVDPRLKP